MYAITPRTMNSSRNRPLEPMKYFTVGEFTRSAVADRYGIPNRLPSMAESDNIHRLVINVLDPLRGYRCPRLNAIVGGSSTSDHMKGCAADIQSIPNNPEENRKLFNLIRELHLPFDQLIDESGMKWVHVSHRTKGNRGQVFSL